MVEEATSKQKILAKLHAVMSDVGYIQKDKQNPFHKYTYLSEEAVKRAVQAAMVKHRVWMLHSVDSVEHIRETVTQKGGVMYLTRVWISFRFYDVDSGESIGGRQVADGIDGEDKGVFKALTAAIREALKANLLIPAGNDPEEDRSTESQAPSNDPREKAKRLWAKVRDTAGVTDELLAAAMEQALGVSALKEAEIEAIVAKLKKLDAEPPEKAAEIIRQVAARKEAPPAAQNAGPTEESQPTADDSSDPIPAANGGGEKIPVGGEKQQRMEAMGLLPKVIAHLKGQTNAKDLYFYLQQEFGTHNPLKANEPERFRDFLGALLKLEPADAAELVKGAETNA